MMQNSTRKYILLLVLLLAIGAQRTCFAQSRVQRVNNLQGLYTEKMSVSLVPLPLFFDGFRIDYDCRLKDNLWLQLAPQYNHMRKGTDTRTDGFCLDANLRYYIFQTQRARGFYLAGGIGVDYNRIAQSSDDLPVTTGQPLEFTGFYAVNAFRFGGQVLLGWQLGLWPRGFIDFYVGAAFRHSSNSFDLEEYRETMSGIELKPWMYQFSGIYMQAGIRIGIML